MSERAVTYLDIKDVDQEALQADYEPGTLSLRELSAKFGMDPKKGHVQITRLAKRKGWTQDLGPKIHAKAEAKLRRATVPAEKVPAQKGQAAPRIADAVVIEANAEALLSVRLRHRTDICRGLGLSMKLMSELELQTDNLELLQQLGELLRREDDNGNDKLNDLYQKIISTPGRIKSMKDLADTMKSLIGLEREAWSIGAVNEKPAGPEDMPEDELNAQLGAMLAEVVKRAG